jgi:hypothetical protein
MIAHRLTLLATLAAAFLAGCAHQRPAPYDYSAFQKAHPASLLVLPPLNDSPDVKATSSVWSNATRPLSEAGYYVLPVTLVDATFKQNGITDPADAHAVAWQKLHEVFGADAAVYIKVKRYGTSYQVVASDTRVEASARVVDLRTGDLLWEGSAMASSSENNGGGGGGIAGLLVKAIVDQIVKSATDASFTYAAIADTRMLAPRYNGILPGPRSPQAGQVAPAP